MSISGPGHIDLDILCSKVAWPAVAAVLHPDELTSFKIEVRAQRGDGDFAVTLTVLAKSERYVDVVYESSWLDLGDHPIEYLRERLVSNLQDFVAESEFGWGELRKLGDLRAIRPAP